MHRKIKNKQGLTVLELVISIAIASILIVVSINLLRVTSLTHSQSLKEYDLQSSIRIATEEANKIVRYSKAVFAIPQTFVESTDKMDPDWNYYMVSRDSKRIVSMEYSEDKGKFVERVLVPEQKNIEYEVFFEKDSDAKADNVMKFIITAYIVDSKGNRTDEKIVYETSVESVNAVQVVDRGTGINKGAAPSLALAYRSDGQTAGKGRNDFAYITLIVDLSSSMNKTPDDKTPSSRNGKSRIELVKQALTGYGTNGEGIIQKFSKEDNIYISFVPFSVTANYPVLNANTQDAGRHEIYDIYREEDKNELISIIDGIYIPDGQGTNTGDGIRRAYHLHNNFRGEMEEMLRQKMEETFGDRDGEVDEDYPIHHYTILLVDGKSTYDVKNGIWNRNIYGNSRNGYYYRWDWTAATRNPIYYLEDGDIKITTPSNYIHTAQQTTDPGVNHSINGTGIENKTNLDNIGTKYVAAVGELIRNFKDLGKDEEIKSYIIGYANDLRPNINDIGTAIGTNPEKIYAYDDPGFDINEVFRDIANDILADFWVVTGPQIQNRR